MKKYISILALTGMLMANVPVQTFPYEPPALLALALTKYLRKPLFNAGEMSLLMGTTCITSYLRDYTLMSNSLADNQLNANISYKSDENRHGTLLNIPPILISYNGYF